MFGWLFPRPPLEVLEKAWVETRLLMLARQFGLARLLEAPVMVPAAEFLDDTWEATPAHAQRLARRLADHLRINNPVVDLECCLDDHACGAGGECGSGVKHTAQAQLSDPVIVAAALTRGLARTLLPEDRQAGHDSAWLADLLGVYLGLGVFVANAVVHVAASPEDHARRALLRGEAFLPARMVGYALALFTWVRGEANPPWRTALRLDALIAYTQGLRYLERTSDSTFTYESASRPYQPTPTLELVRQLMSGSPSARVVTLWELRGPQHGPLAAHVVATCLRDRRPALRQEAALTLGCYGEHARQAVEPLLDLLQDGQYSVRSAAATVLGTLGHDIDVVLPQLIALLRDPDHVVVSNAAWALQSFQGQGLPAVPALLAALKTALIRCDRALVDVLSHTLFAIDPDPTERVMQYFSDDYELREQLVHILGDAAQAGSGDPLA